MALRTRILVVLLIFSIVPAATVALITTNEATNALEVRIAGSASDAALRAGRELDALLFDGLTALDRQLAFDEVFENVLLSEDDDPTDLEAGRTRVTMHLSRFRSACPIFSDVLCLKDTVSGSGTGTRRDGTVFAVSAIEGQPARFDTGTAAPSISAVPLAVDRLDNVSGFGKVPRSALQQLRVLDRHPEYPGRVVVMRIGALLGDQAYSLVGIIEWTNVLAILPDITIQGDSQGAGRVLQVLGSDGTELYRTAGVTAREMESDTIRGAKTAATGWEVRVYIDSQTARAPVSGLLGSVLAIVAVVIVLTALLSRLIAKWLADPVAAEMAKKHAELEDLNRSLAGANTALEDSLSAKSGALKEAEDARASLAAQLDIVREQQSTIRALSVPAIQVWDRVLMVPLIGVVDAQRAQVIMEELLQQIAETRTKIVLMDITGVDSADTQTAFHFIKIAKATRLMGAQFILTGVRAHVARTLVNLDVSFEFVTRQILSDGLRLALTATGWRIVHDRRRHHVERDTRDVQSDDDISPIG